MQQLLGLLVGFAISLAIAIIAFDGGVKRGKISIDNDEKLIRDLAERLIKIETHYDLDVKLEAERLAKPTELTTGEVEKLQARNKDLFKYISRSNPDILDIISRIDRIEEELDIKPIPANVFN